MVASFVETEIYYEDEEYGYVDKHLFNLNTFLFDQNTNERFRVSLFGTLEGVFNVNKGYAVFRRIEKIKENEEQSQRNGYKQLDQQWTLLYFSVNVQSYANERVLEFVPFLHTILELYFLRNQS